MGCLGRQSVRGIRGDRVGAADVVMVQRLSAPDRRGDVQDCLGGAGGVFFVPDERFVGGTANLCRNWRQKLFRVQTRLSIGAGWKLPVRPRIQPGLELRLMIFQLELNRAATRREQSRRRLCSWVPEGRSTPYPTRHPDRD